MPRDMSFNVRTETDPWKAKAKAYERIMWAMLEAVGGEILVTPSVWRTVAEAGPNPRIGTEKFQSQENPMLLGGVVYRNLRGS